jgi:hypothetical protein
MCEWSISFWEGASTCSWCNVTDGAEVSQSCAILGISWCASVTTLQTWSGEEFRGVIRVLWRNVFPVSTFHCCWHVYVLGLGYFVWPWSLHRHRTFRDVTPGIVVNAHRVTSMADTDIDAVRKQKKAEYDKQYRLKRKLLLQQQASKDIRTWSGTFIHKDGSLIMMWMKMASWEGSLSGNSAESSTIIKRTSMMIIASAGRTRT